MKECWAKKLENCNGGLSGEHVISKGLFGEKVRVQGFPWLKGETKVIGINALTANVLCVHHNNTLSEVDAEGVKAFRAIRKFEEILSGRDQSFSPSDLEHNVDGVKLERWFIKHAINLFAANAKGGKWYNGSEASDPPLDIVQAAFGKEKLSRPRGLYNYAGGQDVHQKVVGDQVAYTPAYDNEGRYLGAAFEFQALSFLIWLTDGNSYEPVDYVKQFYHHMGGIFQAPPIQASFNVVWT